MSIFEEITAVTSICEEIGLGRVAPTLLKAADHTSLLIAPQKIVARVQSGEPVATARDRAAREVAVTRHLADRGAPTLAPDRQFAGPYIRAPAVVTFWPYAAGRRAASEADASLAGLSLARVHRCLQDFDGTLPPYTGALDRCWAILSGDQLVPALSSADRQLLKEAFWHLRRKIEGSRAEWVPLHGDSHLGNLLLGHRGDALWLDFTETCLGPREYDIANLPVAAWAMFSDVDPAIVAAYAFLKSACVAVWCSADPSRSPEVQEAADYHLDVIRNMTR